MTSRVVAKEKYYVVWQGRKPGIYESWADCREQVHGAEGASYKSFPTRAEAQAAYEAGAPARQQRKKTTIVAKTRSVSALPDNPPEDRHDTVLNLPPEVTANALAVDAACSGNPGKMEYRGVDLATGQEVFHFGPVWGTNNIGEFLAIVHGLAWLKQRGEKKTIYSDSRNAMLWVRGKKCKTTLARTARTEELYQIIARAEKWLAENRLHVPLKKWETSKWGEIPADFGRK